MSFLFGGLPCLDPASLPPLAKAALRGRRVNVYDCPLGCRPGFADLVVLRWHLNQLGLSLPQGSKFRELVIFDSNNVKLVFPHFVVTGHATALCPGAPDDETTPYLLRVADKRWLHWDRGEKINAAYNVRTLTDGAYYAGTLNSGTAYTWAQILTAIWPSGMGTCPDLPFTPSGTPEGFWYEGMSKWQAVEDFLNRLCCKVKYDPFDDTARPCSIVRLGEDSTVDKYLAKFEKARVWDEYPVTGRIASWPEKIRVQFRVRPSYSDGTSPVYTVEQTVTTYPAQGDAPGTVVVIDDDLYATNSNGTISNTSALSTRATERRTDWERKRLNYDTGKMISYVGALNMMPAIGGKWGRIVWKEDEAGATTTIAAGVNDDRDVWKSIGYIPESTGIRDIRSWRQPDHWYMCETYGFYLATGDPRAYEVDDGWVSLIPFVLPKAGVLTGIGYNPLGGDFRIGLYLANNTDDILASELILDAGSDNTGYVSVANLSLDAGLYYVAIGTDSALSGKLMVAAATLPSSGTDYLIFYGVLGCSPGSGLAAQPIKGYQIDYPNHATLGALPDPPAADIRSSDWSNDPPVHSAYVPLAGLRFSSFS